MVVLNQLEVFQDVTRCFVYSMDVRMQKRSHFELLVSKNLHGKQTEVGGNSRNINFHLQVL